MPETLNELTPEEQKNLTEEITAVLAKYNAEMGVSSHIEMWKRAPETGIPSPLTHEDIEHGDNNAETSKAD